MGCHRYPVASAERSTRSPMAGLSDGKMANSLKQSNNPLQPRQTIAVGLQPSARDQCADDSVLLLSRCCGQFLWHYSAHLAHRLTVDGIELRGGRPPLPEPLHRLLSARGAQDGELLREQG